MDDRKFSAIVTALVILGLISVAVMVAVTVDLYLHCSIISYIQNRG